MEKREKMLKGIISILIIKELLDGPLHGYAIEKKISDKIEGKLPPGMIYVILKSLEKKGCVRKEEKLSDTSRNVKIYYITDHGKDFLISHEKQLKIMKKLIDDILGSIEEKFK
ncbi:MAG: PadR family transcriptional regulator [Thermoplasmata archaeon]|nr:PadR family transcriptional regulator [Thermoplasmata archaeon]